MSFDRRIIMENQVVTLDMDYVKSYMNKFYELVYIDYDSNLDDSLESVNEAIQKQDWCPLDESQDEWMMQSQMDGLDYVWDELKKELYDADDFFPEEIDTFMEDNRSDIEEEIFNRDTGTPMDDLIRHTKDPVMFYDLEVDVEYGYDQESYDNNFQAIKEALSIEDDSFNTNIETLLVNASYGGRLVVYFVGDIKSMMELEMNGYNTISFKNPNVAIIDRMNGSGSDDCFDKLELSFPLDIRNIYIDKVLHYNYTYSVCGMSNNWCDDTIVKFGKE